MLQIFQGIRRFFHQEVNRQPRHIRPFVVGDSLNDCLRKLEKEAGLPLGDLSLKEEPMEVSTWPVIRSGLRHSISSKTSEKWRADETKDGYIAGSVFEATGPAKLYAEQSSGLVPLAAAVLRLADSMKFQGFLHISKDCPGVYQDGVCTTCGDIS